MLYKIIINPINNKKYNINSKCGKNILKKYIDNFNYVLGGAESKADQNYTAKINCNFIDNFEEYWNECTYIATQDYEYTVSDWIKNIDASECKNITDNNFWNQLAKKIQKNINVFVGEVNPNNHIIWVYKIKESLENMVENSILILAGCNTKAILTEKGYIKEYFESEIYPILKEKRILIMGFSEILHIINDEFILCTNNTSLFKPEREEYSRIIPNLYCKKTLKKFKSFFVNELKNGLRSCCKLSLKKVAKKIQTNLNNFEKNNFKISWSWIRKHGIFSHKECIPIEDDSYIQNDYLENFRENVITKEKNEFKKKKKKNNKKKIKKNIIKKK